MRARGGVETLCKMSWCRSDCGKRWFRAGADEVRRTADVAIKHHWMCGPHYWHDGYECVGLQCLHTHLIVRAGRAYQDVAEWHVTLEDVLEEYTYCPWCGPNPQAKLKVQ